jgi:hypothetical protein
MKLDTISPLTNSERLEMKKQQEKELTLVGTERKQKGLTLFEYDKATCKIEPAEYETTDVFVLGMEAQSKVNVRPNCIYIQAMNKKNALKKVRKILA